MNREESLLANPGYIPTRFESLVRSETSGSSASSSTLFRSGHNASLSMRSNAFASSAASISDVGYREMSASNFVSGNWGTWSVADPAVAKAIQEGLQETDVICTRDRFSNKHPGNKRYQAIIRAHRDAYQASKLNEAKSTMTRSVIHIVKDMGGRFVKYNKQQKKWLEIPENAAHDKVSHALRSTTKDEPKKKKSRIKSSGTTQSATSNGSSSSSSIMSSSVRSSYNNVYSPTQTKQQLSLFHDIMATHPEEAIEPVPLAPSVALSSSSQQPLHQQQQQQHGRQSLHPLPSQELIDLVSSVTDQPFQSHSNEPFQSQDLTALDNLLAKPDFLDNNTNLSGDMNNLHDNSHLTEGTASAAASGPAETNTSEQQPPPSKPTKRPSLLGRVRRGRMLSLSKQISEMSLTPIPLTAKDEKDQQRMALMTKQISDLSLLSRALKGLDEGDEEDDEKQEAKVGARKEDGNPNKQSNQNSNKSSSSDDPLKDKIIGSRLDFMAKQMSEMSLTPFPLSSRDLYKGMKDSEGGGTSGDEGPDRLRLSRHSSSDGEGPDFKDRRNLRNTMSKQASEMSGLSLGLDENSRHGMVKQASQMSGLSSFTALSTDEKQRNLRMGMSKQASEMSGMSLTPLPFDFERQRSARQGMSKQASEMSLTPLPINHDSRLSITAAALNGLGDIDESENGQSATSNQEEHSTPLVNEASQPVADTAQLPVASETQGPSFDAKNAIASSDLASGDEGESSHPPIPTHIFQPQGDSEEPSDEAHSRRRSFKRGPSNRKNGFMFDSMFESMDSMGKELMNDLSQNDWSLDEPKGTA